MKTKLKKYLSTIRARLLLSTVSLMIVISVIITCAGYYIVSYNLRRTLVQTAETRLSFLCTSIDDNIENVTGFISICQTGGRIRDFVMETPNGSNAVKRVAREMLAENYSSNAALPAQLIRVVIGSNVRDDILQLTEASYSSAAVSSEAVTSLPYFRTLSENSGRMVMGIVPDPFLYTRRVQTIPFVSIIQHPYRAGEIGYIFTEMSTSVITDAVRSYLPDTEKCFYIKIGDYTYKYEEGRLEECRETFALVEDLSDRALSSDTVIQEVESGGSGSSIMITRPMRTAGWYVTARIEESVLSRNVMAALFPVMLAILACASVIGVLFSIYLNKTINVPVKKLQERIDRISGGDFSRDTETEWPHEMGVIGRNINDLAENVSRLMDQKLEDERQKKDYEYRMLQSQINPHFLYNTLNSIKWMATIQNAPGIAEMTTSLSRLLKDISKGTTNLVSIGHELSLIEDYFTIQKYRYGGTVSLSVRVDGGELKECGILKFTLQPIVENAIFHGIEPKGSTGAIDIHVRRSGGDIVIEVTDDGVGIEPEVAGRLLDERTPSDSAFFKEIGIANVHKRLKYEYGADYGLSIRSEPGRFTTVIIRIPCAGPAG